MYLNKITNHKVILAILLVSAGLGVFSCGGNQKNKSNMILSFDGWAISDDSDVDDKKNFTKKGGAGKIKVNKSVKFKVKLEKKIDGNKKNNKNTAKYNLTIKFTGDKLKIDPAEKKDVKIGDIIEVTLTGESTQGTSEGRITVEAKNTDPKMDKDVGFIAFADGLKVVS